MALSADGKRVLTGSANHTAILWDTENAKPIQAFKGHASYVLSVALSIDGKRVLTGSGDNTAILWDTETAKPIQTFKGHTNWVFSVGAERRRQARPHRISRQHRDPVGYGNGRPNPGLPGAYSLGFFRGTERRREASANWVLGQLCDPVGNGKGQAHPDLQGAHQSGLVRRPQLRRESGVLTGSNDDTAILWDTETAKPIQTFKGHTDQVLSAALTRDGKRVLTGSGDKAAILWNAETAKPIQTFNGHTGGISSVALSGDGKRLLTGSADNTAILWDSETAKPIQTFNGHTDGISSVALSGDGRRVLTGSHDSTAILWDSETAKPIQRFKRHINAVSSVALSADGKRVLTGSWDGNAIQWDTEKAKPIKTLDGHTDDVSSLALSVDGKRVLTGSDDKTAILWDAETAKPIQSFRGHVGGISSVAFSPSGRYILTSSLDGTVRLWKPGRDEALFCFLASGSEWLFWTPEGYYTCSPNGESLIAWKLPGNSPGGYQIVGPEQFRKKFYRPDMFRHLLNELDLNRALALADRESDSLVEAPTTIAKLPPPVVLIIDPKRDAETDRERFTIEAVAVSNGDLPVTRMRILINGRSYNGNLSIFEVPDPRPGAVRRSWDVELEPGEFDVQVIADTSANFGKSEIRKIRRKDLAESLPRLRVLAVGVTAYEKESLRKNVEYAAADAISFANAMKASRGTLYRDFKATCLVDKDANRKKILEALLEIKKETTMTDTTMVFFAGHGDRDDQGNFYFLPVETDEIVSSGVSEDDLKTRLRALPGRVFLMLDACHSGAAVESRGRDVGGLTDRLYREVTSNEHGLIMFCSSMGMEQSLQSPQHKSGMFTLALTEGLQGKAAKSDEGVVYLDALKRYIAERVRQLSEGRQHPLMFHPTIRDIPLTKP